IQGLGGGGLSAVIYASVARCYPFGSQPRMLALISTSWVVPGLVGPGLGGFVADHASWRPVFIGLTPAVLLCAILTMPALRRLGRAPRGSSDGGREVPFGFAFLIAASGALVLLALQSRSALAGAALLVAGVAGALPGVRRLMPAGTLRAEPGLPAAI